VGMDRRLSRPSWAFGRIDKPFKGGPRRSERAALMPE